MNIFLTALIGAAFAASVVFAAPSQRAEELVKRFYIVADQDDITAIWRDLNPNNWQGWHPKAEIRMTVKYGFPYKDDEISVKVADWGKFPNLWNSLDDAAALDDYVEQSRGPRSQKVTPSGSGFRITTQRKVTYTWKGVQGQMLETDRFELETSDGQILIQRLHSTYDYR